MQALIYKTDSDKKKLNKNISLIKEVNVNLLSDTNILNPYFELSNIPIADLANANYLYIPNFKRYYYIDSIELLTSGNVAITASVDVLMSHKEQILNVTGTVKRSENLKNGYIIDENYKSVAYSRITTKRFPNAMTNDSFILMTVG